MKNYLIFDMGTGNSRVALAGSDGKIHGMRQLENVYDRDLAYPDAQYFHPGEWKEKIMAMARELLEEFPAIRLDAITASGCRQTTVFLDGKGQAIYGIPNMDHRGKAYLKEIPDKKMVYEKTGKWVSTFPAGNLYGIKKARRSLFGKIQKFTSLSEWMGLVLTGRLVMEISLACETQLLDIGRKEWSDELFQLYGFPRSLAPELANGPISLGNATGEGKRLLGISYDVPFIVSGADTQNAVLGAEGEVGDITMVSGTTSPCVFNVEKKFYDEKERCWVDLNIGGRNYFIETNPGVTGLNIQRMKHVFFRDASYGEIDEKMMEKEKAKVGASFTSLLFETGEHIKKGGFFMDAPWNQEVDRFDFAAAAWADIACALHRNYKKLTELAAHERGYVRGCGGGFQSRFLCQTLADLLGKDLLLPKGFSQSSILGCVKLMNQYLEAGEEEKGGLGDFQVYHPSAREFSHSYYEKWTRFQEFACEGGR